MLLHLSGCSSSDKGDDIPSTGVDGIENKYVVYEVNPKLFGTSGAFNAIAGRLDEIKSLGVNVLWIMPVYEEGVLKSVGSPYCVKNYKQLNAQYGTLVELRSLVDKAHGKGMSVLFDWIANHTSWDNAWIENKAWYTQDAGGNIISPAGMGWADVADLNFDNTDMRKAMLDAMKYWVTEANIDGYRCDYADGVPDDFWKQAIAELKTLKGDDLVMLGEGSRSTLFADGFDMVFSFSFASKLQEVYAGKETLSTLYTTHKQEYANVPEGKQRLRYITNHDLASENSPLKVYKTDRGAMSAFVLTTMLAGSPLIYSSQEVGYASALSFFNTRTLDWSANAAYLAEYKKVMGIYTASDALRKGTLKTYETGSVATFYRESQKQKVLVLVNTTNQSQTVRIPIERAGDNVKSLLDGATSVLPASLELEPYQYCIWQKQ